MMWPFKPRPVIAILPVIEVIFSSETGEYDYYLSWKVVR
jgi:hypothetical protein